MNGARVAHSFEWRRHKRTGLRGKQISDCSGFCRGWEGGWVLLFPQWEILEVENRTDHWMDQKCKMQKRAKNANKAVK